MKLVTSLAAATALALSLPLAGLAAQPHMEEALTQLQQARDSLEKASADKGGYRAKAIKSVDKAIADVKAGIEYDKTHESKGEVAKQVKKP